MDRMNELINELNKASALYYNGEESFLTDAEYDSLFDKLKTMEKETGIIYTNSPTINVGAPVLSEIATVKIVGKPMLSLDKVHSPLEIVNFAKGEDIIGSIKCDGLSVRLIYEDGRLVSANTRGNGREGGDISEHIKHFVNVPLVINKTGRYIIDGEAIIYQLDFEMINAQRIGGAKYKNPRNLASGSLTLYDMSIVKQRKLNFIAWDVIEGGSTNFYHYNAEEAQSLGFTFVPARVIDATKVEEKEIDDCNKELLKEAEELGIPCDGVVWRINDIQHGIERGETEHHFLNAIAFKPENKLYATTLLDIELSMGRTGVLTPVAVFEPVDCGDSIIERASLHNISVMLELFGGKSPRRGQQIYVAKMNMIIPQVIRAISNTGDEKIFFNDQVITCPVCGENLIIKKSDSGVLNYVCENPTCEGKLINRLDHYLGIKGLNIKGISKMTLNKLIEWNWINSIKDIYNLKEHRDEWIKKPGFGVASVDKVLSAIEENSKHVSLVNFISALGIPLVGKAVAKQITKYYSTWNEFMEAIGGDWSEFDGFGDIMSREINNFDYTEANEIVDTYLTFEETKEEVRSDKLAGMSFCVTGKLKIFKKRDDLKADIESKGGKMVNSVTSKTTYLVTNTPDSGTAKNTQAQKLGIPIITEEEYLKL